MARSTRDRAPRFVIYLDHHAATPLSPQVRDAIDRALRDGWANPSSTHGPGRAARAMLEEARRAVASAVSVRPSDVVFTSGGSEACQTGIEGIASGIERIVTSSVEHPAVARTIESLERSGIEVVRLPPTPNGLFELSALEEAIGERVLVALQWVNHEVGAIAPIEEVALRCRARGARLFVDATQALGKVPVDLGALGASTVALAATKIGGPAGAGAIVVAPGVELEPSMLGGAQERGLRAGTPSVPTLVGFGAAASQVPGRLAEMRRIATIRDRLEATLERRGGVVHAKSMPRVATCSSVGFAGRRATVLAAALDLEGVAVATGPACSSGLDSPSTTVLALRPDAPELARSTIRISYGPSTTDEEMALAARALELVLDRGVLG